MSNMSIEAHYTIRMCALLALLAVAVKSCSDIDVAQRQSEITRLDKCAK